jgi:hypothetical protein
MPIKKENRGHICPYCHGRLNKVTNTYDDEYTWRGMKHIRLKRRRVCCHCGFSFITFETVEEDTSAPTSPPKEEQEAKPPATEAPLIPDHNPYLPKKGPLVPIRPSIDPMMPPEDLMTPEKIKAPNPMDDGLPDTSENARVFRNTEKGRRKKKK